MAGSTSSYLGDSFENIEPLSAAQQEALNNKLGVEVDRITTIMDDDTGKYQAAFNGTGLVSNLGSTSTPTSTPAAVPVSTPPPPPDYYIKDKKEGNSYSIPSSKNLLGGNLDVSQNLEPIIFEQYGDGSLKNAIAYIIPWQRAESNTQSALQNGSPSSPRDDGLNEVINGFSPVLRFNTEGAYNYEVNSPSIPVWNTDESLWEGSSFGDAFSTDLNFFQGDDRKGSFDSNYFSNPFETGINGEVTLSQSEAEKRQTSLSSEIPMGWKQGILAGGRFLADQLIQDPRTGSFVDTAILQASRLLKVPSGPVYVGNANGLINQILDYANIFGFNVPRGLTTSVAPDLQSKRSKIEAYQPGPEPLIGMWQFLFNPSELTLTAGPEFKETETWGVSDEPNIGKPLHFTTYKNPELKFSKVLLNGYVFGKKVESLQQGLFKLFLENPTNDAKHGPRVLEFVWGKRSFGPCMMKDISITEKMWDDGELVNAEVSFTLVKVPEWTINDGQVSTFDPTAIPLIASPTKTTPSEAKESDDGEGEKTQPPRVAADADHYSYIKCKSLATAVKDTGQLIDNGVYFAKEAGNNFDNPLNFVKERIGAIDAYDRMLGQYSNWLTRVSLADSSTLYPTKCGRDYFNQKRTELTLLPGPVNSDEKAAFSSKTILEMNTCINTIRKTIINSYNQGKCTNYKNPGSSDPFDIFAPVYTDPNKDFANKFWTTL